MKRDRSAGGSKMTVTYLLLSALLVSVLSLEVDIDVELKDFKDGSKKFYHPHEHLDVEYRKHPELNPCQSKKCAEGETCHVVRNPVMLQLPIALCEKEEIADKGVVDAGCSSFVLASNVFQCKTESEWADLAKKQCQIRLDVIAEGVFATVRYPCRFGRQSSSIPVFQQAAVSCCKLSLTSNKPTPAATKETFTTAMRPTATAPTTEWDGKPSGWGREPDEWDATTPDEKPTGWDEKPTEWDGKPTGWDEKPTEWDGKPTGWDEKPTEWDGKPTEWDGKPTGWDEKPTEWDGKPTGWDEKPTEWDGKPTEWDGKPTGWDDKSAYSTKSTDTVEPMTDTTQPPVTTEPDKWDTTTGWKDWKTTASEWEYTTDHTTTIPPPPEDFSEEPLIEVDVLVEDKPKADHPRNHHHLLWFILPIVVVVSLCGMACLTFCLVRACMTRRRLNRVHKRFPADPPQRIFANESYDDSEEEVYSKPNTGIGGYEPANNVKPVLIFRNDSNGDMLAYDMFIAGKQ